MFRTALTTKRSITILPIGRSGAGKSTIGNFVLTGEHNAPFKTSTGVESCTQEAEPGKDANVTFVDLPGLPDTDPSRTMECYNTCIDRLKGEVSVIMFVFKKEKIDLPSYEQAEVLFREINEVDCMKVLVINDHTNYAFGQPESDEAECSKLAVKIAKCTKIDFDKYVFMNASNVKTKISALMKEIKDAKPDSVRTPDLKNFDEVESYVDHLREKKSYKETIFSAMEKKKKRLKREKRMAEVLFGGSVLATIGAGVAVPFTVGGAIPALGAAGGSVVATKGTAEALKMRIRRLERKIASFDYDEAARELEVASESFLQLKDAIHANAE